MQDVAVAIKYNFGESGDLPKVVASGRGFIAQKIIEIARNSDVPVQKEKELAESLAKIPVGVEIPAELWEAVATVLAHIFRLNQNANM
ncbi:MAG: EscU/YscU/HrcU family type III secretion system export apparatus switch protein [Candidatus Riflebacteria bacterium]|nr:EscU/YscU/HrcU family type III secretion system export apparatus switch protein [Candidatus Riflebacteria bacterium]